MATVIAFRNIGPTVVSSVTASSTAAVTIPAPQAEIMGFAAFINTGSVSIAVNIAPIGTAAAAVLPVAGTPQTVIVLPPLMTQPTVYAVPNGFSFTAIGTAAGPSLVYVTPIGSI